MIIKRYIFLNIVYSLMASNVDFPKQVVHVSREIVLRVLKILRPLKRPPIDGVSSF